MILEKRKREDFSDELSKRGWYHSMELPSGVNHGFLSLDELKQRWSRLSGNFASTRLLDIGTWDGWFAFTLG